MTLKEKILADNYLEDYDNPITNYQADNIIQIADDYAIEFMEWSVARAMGFVTFKLNNNELEMFKKEKGL